MYLAKRSYATAGMPSGPAAVFGMSRITHNTVFKFRSIWNALSSVEPIITNALKGDEKFLANSVASASHISALDEKYSPRVFLNAILYSLSRRHDDT